MFKFPILLAILLSVLLQGEPNTVEVTYTASSTNRFVNVEYLDEHNVLHRIILMGTNTRGSKTFQMTPGRWSVAAIGVSTYQGGVSCSLTINGVVVQKDRDTSRDPLSNCSGQVKE
jgi:hypothetical protein